VGRFHTRPLLIACLAATVAGCGRRRPAGEPTSPPAAPAKRAAEAAPPARLTREILDRSLDLGRRFLLNRQRPDGRFVYEYDFLKRRVRRGDSPVRQAGTLWGLALIHLDRPSRETAAAVEKGLAFFERHSRTTPSGGRYVVYPGTSHGRTGTVALLALTLVDYLRADWTVARRRHHEERLGEVLHFLLSLRDEEGQFHARYDLKTGEGQGDPSPYFDGEALLALIRAAKYAGYTSLRDVILESAEAMYRRNVRLPLVTDPDSDTTKGFYQWGTLAWYELITAGWEGTAEYAPRAIRLAYWMIDEHRTLERRRNTAYAHEGLACAWELARLTGDAAAMKKIRGVIEEGLLKLTTWQVGGPAPNAFLRDHPTDDPRAAGGVMNGADDPVLRIDVTQHQMHAVILVRRFLYRH